MPSIIITCRSCRRAFAAATAYSDCRGFLAEHLRTTPECRDWYVSAHIPSEPVMKYLQIDGDWQFVITDTIHVHRQADSIYIVRGCRWDGSTVTLGRFTTIRKARVAAAKLTGDD